MRESDRVYEELRGEILRLELAPGSVLGEAELSRRLGVSRTPVREALRELERDKLVDIRPGRGATVSEISIESVAQIFQMREAVETYAARQAARKGAPGVFEPILADLKVALANLSIDGAPADGYARYNDVVERFDAAIRDTVGNLYLTDALDDLSAHTARLRQLARRNPARMAEAAQEHVEICQAIVSGDANAAAELTAAHIHNSLRGILMVIIEDVTGALIVPRASGGDAQSR